MYGFTLLPIAQAELQQNGNRTNSRDDYHCNRTVKGIVVGEDDYKGK